MTDLGTGWTFTDEAAIDWQDLGPGVAMKMMGGEFTYILEGELISNGVTMTTGHAYAAQAGTTHEEFRTDTGAMLVSVFEPPS